MQPSIPFEGRFIPEPNSGCWLWCGRSRTNGYGMYRGMAAHREAYRRAFGPIPAGMVVRHRCDTPACVNPNHLLIGTQADNLRDIVARRRHWGQKNPDAASAWGKKYGSRVGPPGTANPSAKLTDAAVLDIRNARESAMSLAKLYGVGVATINRIRRRAAWKHI